MRYPILACFICFLSFNITSAQDDDSTRWYWALDENTGALLAYTADGSVNTLIDSGVDLIKGWRVDSSAALVQLFMQGDDQLFFYLLYKDDVQPLSPMFDSDILNFPIENDIRYNYAAWDSYEPTQHSGNYVIFTLSQPYEPIKSLLVNLSIYSIELLPDDGNYRFSEDGRFLRYALRDLEEAKLTLYERNLADNTTYTLTSFDFSSNSFDSVVGDEYGERWLWYMAETVPDTDYAYTLFYNDGTSETLGGLPENYYVFWNFLGDGLAVHHRFCDTNCTLDVYPEEQEIPIQYLLPDRARLGALASFTRLDESRIEIRMSLGSIWVVRADSPPELIGYEGYPLLHNASSKSRWLLVTDTNSDYTQYRVWDRFTNEFTAEGDAEGFVSINITTGGDGFVISHYPSFSEFSGATVYYTDGTLYELPTNFTGSFFEVLPNRSLLFQRHDPSSNGTRSIYRYDIVDETFSLLVANAQAYDFAPLLNP
jgi:hypothetical protein